MAAERPLLTLYTRPGCHLCEVAQHQLMALARQVPFRLHSVNVEEDPALEERYGLEIPVVALDGEVVSRAPLDLAAVRAAIESRA